ncbi:MAG: hypothetical protein ACFFAS_20305 [Promethearchaeota archaeon]
MEKLDKISVLKELYEKNKQIAMELEKISRTKNEYIKKEKLLMEKLENGKLQKKERNGKEGRSYFGEKGYFETMG